MKETALQLLVQVPPEILFGVAGLMIKVAHTLEHRADEVNDAARQEYVALEEKGDCRDRVEHCGAALH